MTIEDFTHLFRTVPYHNSEVVDIRVGICGDVVTLYFRQDNVTNAIQFQQCVEVSYKATQLEAKSSCTVQSITTQPYIEDTYLDKCGYKWIECTLSDGVYRIACKDIVYVDHIAHVPVNLSATLTGVYEQEWHKIQDLLHDIHYPDMEVYDFQMSLQENCVMIYMGYSDEEACWRVRFQQVSEVSYTTTRKGEWTSQVNGKSTRVDYDYPFDNIKGFNLGYFAQNLERTSILHKSEYRYQFQLSLLEVDVMCQNISVEALERASICFYWE